jgi:outer membrane lipoprotein-sorting protein
MKNRNSYLFFLFVLLLPGLTFSNEDTLKKSLTGLKQQFENVKDYKCTFESFTFNGKKSEKFTYKYFFMKPKSIRMEVISGKKEGMVLLHYQDKVRLKLRKGILSLFSFTFDPNEKRVCDVRGHGLNHSDWGWFINRHLKEIDLFDTRFLRKETVEGRETAVYELISKNPEKTDSVLRENIWIDEKNNLIVKYHLYDISDNLVQSSLYRDIVLNSGLKKELFIDFKRK